MIISIQIILQLKKMKNNTLILNIQRPIFAFSHVLVTNIKLIFKIVILNFRISLIA